MFSPNPSRKGGRRTVALRDKEHYARLPTIVLGAVLLVSPVGSALSQLPSSGADGQTSQEPGPPNPELTPAQQQHSLDLVAQDQNVNQILGDTPYEVALIGPSGGDDGGPITGAAMQLRLSDSTSVDMQAWPTVDFRPAEVPPYTERQVVMAATELREVQILVDLNSGEVVSVDPLEPVDITPGPELREAWQQAKEQAQAQGMTLEEAFG